MRKMLSLIRRTFAGLAIASGVFALPSGVNAQDLARLQGLLNATPAGGWVKVSTGVYSDAWATGEAAVPPTPGGPAAVVYAWSSVAWDSNRGNLILWGGGHGNYAGDEVYLWGGASGQWTRGSLSSKTVGNYIVDNAAPQSAHTYDNNVFLPVNDMFANFGGATYNAGNGYFTILNGQTEVRAGPWLWDPRKADPNKVGGTTGSGYDPTSVGGNMWINRQGQWTGTEGPSYGSGASAYRQEAGHDVVYLTMDSNSSQFPGLYKYTLGDVRNGGFDNWQKIGETWHSNIGSGAATIDAAHNLFVRTALNGNLGDLAVWNLANANPQNPSANQDVAVHLVDSQGVPFAMNVNYGVDYDSANDQLILWSGEQQGKVWSTKASFDQNGQISSTWIVQPLLSTTAAQPGGNFGNGVLGKWDYVSELGAFIALNEYDGMGDAEVWLYKPLTAAVPELDTRSMTLFGLVALIGWRRLAMRRANG